MCYTWDADCCCLTKQDWTQPSGTKSMQDEIYSKSTLQKQFEILIH